MAKNPEGGEQFKLQGIDLVAEEGELVEVIGKVSSGKTSLASAICGFMPQTTGAREMRGRCAYVPQATQILNDTVKGNIYFHDEKPFEEARYDETLKVCQLKDDLAAFQAGDRTEIGEKGGGVIVFARNDFFIHESRSLGLD